MRSRLGYRLAGLLLGLMLLTLLSCEGFRLPRFSHEKEMGGRAPITVTYVFDNALREARLEQAVCGNNTWEGHLGNDLIKAFLEVGRTRFNQAVLAPPEGSPKPAAEIPSDVTAQVRLVRKSFQGTDRMGMSDQFMAQLDIELAVTYQDRNGVPVLESPLLYSDQLSLYTPMLGSGGTQCATGQLDAALRNAAEFLANRLAETIFRLGSRIQPSAQTAAATGQFQAQPGAAGSVTFRATMLDENDNQILEGGEKVGVRVDVTNQGATPILAASLVLAGTPSLIDAFSAVLAAPLQVGPLQPGETKSTVFWGRMPDQVQSERGELTVSLASPELAALPSNQILIGAIRPGFGPFKGPQTSGLSTGVGRTSPGGQGAFSGLNGPAAGSANRYAVIVGLDRYREASLGARSLGSIELEAAPDLLAHYGKIPENQILTLRDDRATRLDIEEALVKWLPNRINSESVVLVYFAGQALVEPRSGTVYLVPYDATPTSAARRLISLPALQRVMGRLTARLAVLLIEAPISPLKDGSSRATRKGTKPPDWQGVLASIGHDPVEKGKKRTPDRKKTTLVQIVRSGDSLSDSGRLLAWLQGGADADRDGQVTLGELIHSLRGTAQIFPNLSPSAPERTLPLAGSKS